MDAMIDFTSASFIRTIPSVWELHPINLKRLADYTAGEDFHLAPKLILC